MRALLVSFAILSSVLWASTTHADPIFDEAKAAPWLLEPAKPIPTVGLEFLYQGISALDVATTIRSGRLPNVEEGGALPLVLFGPHPSPRQDIEFGIGRGLLHALATYELVHHHAANFWILLWEGSTTAPEAIAAYNNSQIR